MFTNYGAFQTSNKTIFDLLYNVNSSVSSNLSLQNLGNPAANSLQALSFYQSSFNWFLARSYNFSGLQTSPLTSSYELMYSPMTKVTELNSSDKLKMALTPYLQSSLLTNNLFLGQLSLPTCQIEVNNVSYGDNSNLSYNVKDVYLSYSAQSAYNSTTLNILLDLLQANTSQPKLFQYPQVSKLEGQQNQFLVSGDYTLNVQLKADVGLTVYPFTASLENVLLGDLVSYTALLNK